MHKTTESISTTALKKRLYTSYSVICFNITCFSVVFPLYVVSQIIVNTLPRKITLLYKWKSESCKMWSPFCFTPAPTAKLMKVWVTIYQYNITLDDLCKEFPRPYCYMRMKKSSLTMLTSKKKNTAKKKTNPKQPQTQKLNYQTVQMLHLR